jgi:hypothetical protein
VPTDRIGRAYGIPAIHCGFHCVWAGVRGKNPYWVWGDREVLDVKPMKGGDSAEARRRRGSTAVTRATPLQGPTGYKTRQGEEKNELPGVGKRRRDGAARRLGAARLTVRRRRSRWRGCMRAPRCLARTHAKLERLKTFQRSGLCLLPGHARRLGHGGARVGAHGGGKK